MFSLSLWLLATSVVVSGIHAALSAFEIELRWNNGSKPGSTPLLHVYVQHFPGHASDYMNMQCLGRTERYILLLWTFDQSAAIAGRKARIAAFRSREFRSSSPLV
ncbi:hypothetical protein [Pararobbsia alpina]|uniref:hypothetical protein n=1 Tax=Pararobbsia alpina TaxID=621374 RepID=UPI001C2E333E|nr:hypothetical protein [Pararobbsia alpina]